MCLIVFAYNIHPKYKLIFAANRDEFYHRPTEQANFWKDHPELLAGKDLQAGGTWMGITKNSKFAAITNYRDLRNIKDDAPSRGLLTLNFLLGDQSAEEYCNSLKNNLTNYNGFNLILGEIDNLFYFSTHKEQLQKLKPGIYGLSNATLNVPWPKVEKCKEVLGKILEQDEIHPWELISLLSDTLTAKDDKLPDTGVEPELERTLSPVFIQSPDYGTRCSTALLIDNKNNVRFVEKTFFNGQGTFSNKDYNFVISR
ncbi:MAG: hypothetical protein DRI23_03165 [Candidatus Cloacimonadota bacterium]|nr:MAG: hypothetical protein DRI23_03165 [Candidatus Cloacimonadota bacterium]